MQRRKFFFYGTLQPGCGTRMARWVERRLVSARPAFVSGHLSALPSLDGWYPALTGGRRGDQVYGQICELRLRAGDLALLDRYEGREYRRAGLRARCAGGRRAIAQTYVWRAVLPAEAQTIEGGDFLGWLAHGQRKVLSPLGGKSMRLKISPV